MKKIITFNEFGDIEPGVCKFSAEAKKEWIRVFNDITDERESEKSKDEFYLVIANNSKPEDYIDYIQKITDKKVVVIDNNELDKYRHTDIDLLLFTGGEDVNPELYGDKVGKYTGISKSRDEIEQKIFHKFGNNIPKLGICRGAQFLTVMAGGKLIQHVENHTRAHSIVLFQEHKFLAKNQLTSADYNVTSTHHQMMYPYNLSNEEYEIIAFSKLHLSETYLNGDDEEIKKPLTFVECEIVYYPRTNSLCIQAHPEYMDVKDKFVNKTIDLIKTKLFKNEQ
jgi:putative glutamine amidotransferase